MTQYAYLACVVVTIGCMVIMDRRWRLFFWADVRRAVPVFLIGTAFFVTWDTVALANDYYDRGSSQFMTGAEIGGVLPVEELFFCAFLPYQSMVLHALAARWLTRTRGRR